MHPMVSANPIRTRLLWPHRLNKNPHVRRQTRHNSHSDGAIQRSLSKSCSPTLMATNRKADLASGHDCTKRLKALLVSMCRQGRRRPASHILRDWEGPNDTMQQTAKADPEPKGSRDWPRQPATDQGSPGRLGLRTAIPKRQPCWRVHRARRQPGQDRSWHSACR